MCYQSEYPAGSLQRNVVDQDANIVHRLKILSSSPQKTSPQYISVVLKEVDN